MPSDFRRKADWLVQQWKNDVDTAYRSEAVRRSLPRISQRFPSIPRSLPSWMDDSAHARHMSYHTHSMEIDVMSMDPT